MIHLYNMDCMEAMASMKTKEFNLAIVDPPYAIGMDKKHFTTKSSKTTANNYTVKNWDNEVPPQKYFEELQRVSKNQIIFGANHFIENIPNANSASWIIWDKNNGNSLHADCELAWTSFDTAVRLIKYTWHGMRQQDMKHKEYRIHPTQKPVALYTWILNRYAQPGWKILDTHLGSGSIAIAAHDLDFELHGYELDKEYFDAATKRLKQHQQQLKLF